MISDELAKELEVAEFPQTTEQYYKFVHTKCSGKNHPKSEHPKKFVLVSATTATGGNDQNSRKHFLELRDDGLLFAAPTLSELIEACGEQFSTLVRDPATGMWHCVAITDGDGSTFIEGETSSATTPDEAVARLWLALHANGGATA
jgi:hypothetical protein